MKLKSKIMVVSVSLALGACSTPQMRVADAVVDKNLDDTSRALARSGEVVARDPAIQVLVPKDGVWMPVKKFDLSISDEGRRLLARKITINRSYESVMEVAQRLTMMFGAPVTVAPDALGGASGTPAGANMPQANSPAPESISIAYSGPLSGFLDIVAARYGLNWSLTDGKVLIFRNVTRTFVIKAVPGSAALSSNVSNGTTNGGAASSNRTTLSAEALSVWKAIEDGIKAILSERGRFVVSPSTGSVTVTDTSSVMGSIEAFIAQQNAHLSRQVTVQVQVLSVSLDESDNYGINWNAVFKSIGGNYGLALANSFTTPEGSAGLSFAIPSTASGALGQWIGSEAVISALAKQGRVSVVTSATAVTLNNQPVPVQVGRQTGYLASSTTTITNGVASTSLTPGTVTTGFSLTVLPHIQDAKSLFLQYSVDISNLLEMQQVTAGDSTIQTPTIETRNFMQRIGLKTGETLVLAGFEADQNSSSSQGVGDARFSVLGGGKGGINSKNIIVILLRPTLSANQ